jgi:hypothetical protein
MEQLLGSRPYHLGHQRNNFGSPCSTSGLVLSEHSNALVPMNVSPLEANQLTGTAKSPVHRQQQTAEFRASAMIVFRIGGPEHRLELFVCEIAIPPDGRWLADLSERMRRDDLLLDTPIEASLHRPQGNSLRSRIQSLFQGDGEVTDVQGPDRVGCECPVFVNEHLTGVAIAFVRLGDEVTLYVIQKLLAQSGNGNRTVDRCQQFALSKEGVKFLLSNLLALTSLGKTDALAVALSGPVLLGGPPPQGFLISAPCWNRTNNLLIKSQLFYQWPKNRRLLLPETDCRFPRVRHICLPSTPTVSLRRAATSVFHQRHFGRMLRSSCDYLRRGLVSSRDCEHQPGRCLPLSVG